MSVPSEIRVRTRASPGAVRPLRHLVAQFLTVTHVSPDRTDDIVTAVGEALANVAEHAYERQRPDVLELYVGHGDDGTICVEVTDRGTFVERERRSGRGFGLQIIRSIARECTLVVDGGTKLVMRFDAAPE